jgi:hypothetical protein
MADFRRCSSNNAQNDRISAKSQSLPSNCTDDFLALVRRISMASAKGQPATDFNRETSEKDVKHICQLQNEYFILELFLEASLITNRKEMRSQIVSITKSMTQSPLS